MEFFTMAALLGRKLGMTRFFTEDGKNVPVTVIEAGPCTVSQVKTTESDGYAAVQISFGDMKPRNSTMPRPCSSVVCVARMKATSTMKRMRRMMLQSTAKKTLSLI